MLIKMLIVFVILIVLRKHLSIFKPFWPIFVGFSVGAGIGWWWCSQIIRLGTTFACLEYFGCPQGFAKPIFAFVGGLVTTVPVSAAIYSLIPPSMGEKNELR